MSWAAIALFGATIFSGALLLFQVQPLIGKLILPWFGGSPAVWTVAMLFFQLVLLAGYAYAHFSVRYLARRAQMFLHLGLLLAALLSLPITPSASMRPGDGAAPAGEVLRILVLAVGLPYFVLSTTSPLLQAWMARAGVGFSPYRFYALSNLGSLLGLLAYPFLVEPRLAHRAQAILWSAGFGVFAALCGVCALWAWRRAPPSGAAGPATTPETDDAAPVSPATRLMWLTLPACSSILLLAVTNAICQDVAVIPFLWVLPLALYLLSYVICFQHARWYSRPVFLALMVPAMGVCAYLLQADEKGGLFMPIGGYTATLFVCCMVCHGELARLKPQPRRLTSYYLLSAAGSAVGGMLVAIAAPLIFRGYLELPIGLGGCCLLLLIACFRDPRSALYCGRRRAAWILLLAGLGLLTITLYRQARTAHGRPLFASRNFYGILRVFAHVGAGPEQAFLELRHGRIAHGLQFLAPARRRWPTSYYGPDGGAGRTLKHFERAGGRRVGLVGLGVGTLTAYGRTNDTFRCYELNPAVLEYAGKYFSFMRDSPARIEIVLGDARLELEREASQQFDILVLDAFNSDAVPAHLLTVEAFAVYLRHLKADGVIAVHITNLNLNLAPLIMKLAEHFKLGRALTGNTGDPERQIFAAGWILLSNNRVFLETDPIREISEESDLDITDFKLWTDDWTSLLPILRR